MMIKTYINIQIQRSTTLSQAYLSYALRAETSHTFCSMPGASSLHWQQMCSMVFMSYACNPHCACINSTLRKEVKTGYKGYNNFHVHIAASSLSLSQVHIIICHNTLKTMAILTLQQRTRDDPAHCHHMVRCLTLLNFHVVTTWPVSMLAWCSTSL